MRDKVEDDRSDVASRKQIKQASLLVAAIVAFFGSGGIAINYFMVQQRANTNEQRSTKNEERLSSLGAQVISIDSKIGELSRMQLKDREQQKEILDGVNSLKAENVKRLQQELDDAKRELRRRGR